MLQFFAIFSQSGIVLFSTVNQSLNQVINGLIKHVFLEKRTGLYQTDQLQLKYLVDNESEIVYVVGYQKFLQLGYVDKFFTDIQLAFRNKYPDFDLKRIINASSNKQESRLKKILQEQVRNDNFAEELSSKVSKKPKQFQSCDLQIDETSILEFSNEFASTYGYCVRSYSSLPKQETMRSFHESSKSKKTIASITQKEPVPSKKTKRQWDLSGSNPEEFDFSKKPSATSAASTAAVAPSIKKHVASVEDLAVNLEMSDNSDYDDDEDDEEIAINGANQSSKSSFLGSMWKNIARNKVLNEEDLKPILEQLRDHLTSKNVAAEIAEELCKSISLKLVGQNVNTWTNLKKFARDALEEAIMAILSPSRTINILREIQAKPRPPYVIVFCGVNGVGKSTNLAKIANWLMNNDVKVLVVAGDTFRSGAIEQLKTHVMALKAIHERGKNPPTKIELFERGYRRESAALAMEAINYARLNQFNCVMVDTAGRMQDNEPLMRELAKLIKINTPDLTLFVGEALVGNEAVDQLTKFNNSLLDCGCRLDGSSRSAIDGIVLTKFDTIDDQVGAAISMTYVTCQPIVFVGVGQTYRDLKQLDAKAVTKALLR